MSVCFSELGLNLFLTSSVRVWLGLYLSLVVSLSLYTGLTLHLMGLGLLICCLAYIKLPSPSQERVKAVLGELHHGAGQEVGGVVAHRAACLDAPENSLEAIRLAAKNGAKWIEFDVSFTSDLQAVAFHDDTVNRITTASGDITSFSLSQLAELDLATKHPLSDNFSGVRIPTVDQFIAECLKHNIKIIIDLKTYESPEETVSLLTSLYQKYPALADNSLVTSFYPNLLYRLRSSHPEVVTAVSTRPFVLSCQGWEGTTSSARPRYSGIKQLAAGLADELAAFLMDTVVWWVVGLSAVLVHRHVITKEYIERWRTRGVTVMAWTVNCPKEKTFYTKVLNIPVLSDTLEKY